MNSGIVLLTIIGVVSPRLATVADITASDRDSVIVDLTRRLNQLEGSRADDVQRADDMDHFRAREQQEMSRRITELERLRARDLRTMNMRIVKLEALRVRDIRKSSKRIAELKNIHAIDVHGLTSKLAQLGELHDKGHIEMTRRIEEIKKYHSKDVMKMNKVMEKPIHKLVKDVNNLTIRRYPQTNSAFNLDETDGITKSNGNGDLPGIDMDTSMADQREKEARKVKDVSDVTKNGVVKSNVPLSNVNARYRRVDPAYQTVAFYAYLNHDINDPALEHVVAFNHVVTNVSAHYHPQTGIFTCTRAGVHVFSWTIRHSVSNWIETHLVWNGAIFAYSLVGDKDYFTSGSSTAAVHLAVGDEVWVQVYSHTGGADILCCETSFTGYRIQ